MDREAMFDAIIVHLGDKGEIRWDVCSTCSHHVAELFELEFAYTQGRRKRIYEMVPLLPDNLTEWLRTLHQSEQSDAAPIHPEDPAARTAE